MEKYVVCNRRLDAETNEYCEFDGDVEVSPAGFFLCPGCKSWRVARS